MQITQSKLPTQYGLFKIFVYRIGKLEHVALTLGDISSSEPILVRLHSQCLTGDVFGSKRCDCQQQLILALEKISQAGRGIILYLNQEGRGIGLFNKIRAYALQDTGLDTVEANQHLGLPVDAREYAMAAQILKHLKVKAVKLLTNNPEKIKALQQAGIVVDQRVSLEVKSNPNNHKYLLTMKQRLDHQICLQE